MEVAQIAKSIAIRLNSMHPFFQRNPINIDLVELAGLAHDLGHPPFGHNGERALDECMRSAGGFEGNAQTFHILTKTEKKDVLSAFPHPIDKQGVDKRLGLNWCFRSLAGIIKYDRLIPEYREPSTDLVKGIYGCDREIFLAVKRAICGTPDTNGEFRTLEASIMDLADDIAYATYDLEDILKVGLLTPLDILSCEERVLEKVARKVADALSKKFTARDVLNVLLEVFGGLYSDTYAKAKDSKTYSPKELLFNAAEIALASTQLASNGYIRTKFTADLVSECLAGVEVEVNEDKACMSKVVLTRKALKKVESLKHFTFESTIMAPRMRVAERRGYEIIRGLFEELNSNNGHLLLPEDFQELYLSLHEDIARKRVVCDFIAGMTDRYAVEFYGRIFSENPQSIFKPF